MTFVPSPLPTGGQAFSVEHGLFTLFDLVFTVTSPAIKGVLGLHDSSKLVTRTGVPSRPQLIANSRAHIFVPPLLASEMCEFSQFLAA